VEPTELVAVVRSLAARKITTPRHAELAIPATWFCRYCQGCYAASIATTNDR
jgi:hypothetical protein